MTQFVDEKDWDGVDFKKIYDVLEDGTYLNERMYMWDFINQVELIHKKQVKQVPSLLKGDK